MGNETDGSAGSTGSRRQRARTPLYTAEERRRRDASRWTLVQGVLAPLQFLVFLASLVLFRTSFGLTLRAVGEHPKAVDVAGRNVAGYRYAAVLVGTGLAGLGGAFLTLGHSNQFVEGITSGRGFIALAVVVFARWSPTGAFFVSLLFGLFYALQLMLQAQASIVVPYQVLQALPYIMTIVTLVVVRGKGAAPSKLGQPYEMR